MDPLFLCRSLLFLPASNPQAIAKARGLEADMVVLDLEDAVKPEDKDAARAAAVDAAAEGGFGDSLVTIRVNAPGPIQEADLAAVRTTPCDYLIVPRTAGPDDVARVSAAVAKPVLAMVETARGVLNAAAIADQAAALVAGTNDLAADLGIRPGGGREPLRTSLQTILLAARAAGIPAFDGVFNRLEDPEGFEAECLEGRSFGFDGKSLIHPNQVEAANRLFSPSGEELDRARRLVAASTGGAQRFEGEMIERMHVDQARLTLAKARA